MSGRQASGLPTAPSNHLALGEITFNPVMRVGDLSEVQTEKSALGVIYVAELIPAKANPTKRLAHSNGQISWESFTGQPGFPLPLTPSWMAKGYPQHTPCHATPAFGFLRKWALGFLIGYLVSVKANGPTRYCGLNTVERAIWEAAYHAIIGMAHSGKRNCAHWIGYRR